MNAKSVSLNLSVFIFILAILFGQAACKKRSREEVEQIIANSETLRNIDQICKEFPKPEPFELERKNLSGNSVMSIIEYQYHAHMPFESVKDFYQNQDLRKTFGFQGEKYLENWSNSINFRHNEVVINVYNRPPSWIVNVSCSDNK